MNLFIDVMQALAMNPACLTDGHPHPFTRGGGAPIFEVLDGLRESGITRSVGNTGYSFQHPVLGRLEWHHDLDAMCAGRPGHTIAVRGRVVLQYRVERGVGIVPELPTSDGRQQAIAIFGGTPLDR